MGRKALSKYIKKSNGKYTDTETGETDLTADEVVRRESAEDHRGYKRTRRFASENGVPLPAQYIKRRTRKPEKKKVRKDPDRPIEKLAEEEDRYYNRMMRTNYNNLIEKEKPSKAVKNFIATFQGKIHYEDNAIVIDGVHPSIETLCKWMGVKRNRLFQIMDEAESLELIKRIPNGKEVVVYFNPYILNGGMDIYTDVKELFADSKYKF